MDYHICLKTRKKYPYKKAISSGGYQGYCTIYTEFDSKATSKNRIGGFYWYNNPSNCKLYTLDSVQGLLNTDERAKMFVDALAILSQSVSYNIALTSEAPMKRLSKVASIAYVAKTPIGYQRNQLHCNFAVKSAINYAAKIVKQDVERGPSYTVRRRKKRIVA